MPPFTSDTDRPPYPFAATLVAIVGVLLITGGTFGWSTLRNDLGEENIIVSQDGRFFPGSRVDGPFSSYAQAEVLGKRIDELSDSRDTGAGIPEDERRLQIVEEESTRTRLLSGTLGFGVSAMAIAGGLSFVTVGLLSSARGGRARPDHVID